MGSFANSVFSVLLGWIRTAINSVYVGAGQQRQRRRLSRVDSARTGRR